MTGNRNVGERLKELAEAERFLRDKAQALGCGRTWDLDALGKDVEVQVTTAINAITTAKTMCDMAADVLADRSADLVGQVAELEGFI